MDKHYKRVLPPLSPMTTPFTISRYFELYSDSMNDVSVDYSVNETTSSGNDSSFLLTSTFVDGKPSLSFSKYSPIRYDVEQTTQLTTTSSVNELLKKKNIFMNVVDRIINYLSYLFEWYDG